MSDGGSERAAEPREVGEAEIAACYPLMRQLRPHLTSVEELIARWRRQSQDGYRLLALWDERRPCALAGYRVTENLVHGRFLYVDDLVTAEGERSRGHGARLLARLAAEGRARGCNRLVLDTPLDNVLGHRFYYRQGLLARALRFSMPLG
ncbi:MAG: GNAT family N-acetyltransferase [Hyphomicrobiales bacterium]|nr:GNAT family N-acetyltransferase [Hyphomicrobiales bacterium]